MQFLLQWFNVDNTDENSIKLIQQELQNIFTNFEKVNLEEIKLEDNEIPLLYLPLKEDISLSQIKELTDEIIEKIEKFNEEKESQDVRNEFAEYVEDMDSKLWVRKFRKRCF